MLAKRKRFSSSTALPNTNSIFEGSLQKKEQKKEEKNTALRDTTKMAKSLRRRMNHLGRHCDVKTENLRDYGSPRTQSYDLMSHALFLKSTRTEKQSAIIAASYTAKSRITQKLVNFIQVSSP